MVFCGHCGYQLAPGDAICPRCGADVPNDLSAQDPEANNPTEMSQVIQDALQPALPNNDPKPGRRPGPLTPQPLILHSASPNPLHEYSANDATTIMSTPAFQQPQQSHPNYPPQAGTNVYGYNAAGGQAYYPSDQAAIMAQLLAASRKGKTSSLLLILFGLLLLIAAILVFLLNQQGIIFSS
jgi:zinc ribbon protein